MGVLPMWKNLLPQGTRTVELTSGFALLISSILIMARIITDIPEIVGLDYIHTWTIVMAIFGGLHIFTLYEYPKLEFLRTALSWLSGCFWIWVSLAMSHIGISIEHVATFMLGIGNLYGFIINLNLLHISWTESSL